ncbi:MAG: VOC family protein [Pseudomonadota bacterium]
MLKFDHVNVRTANLNAMRTWYAEVLGLSQGWRPDFAFPGAWMYAGDEALVHLVGVEAEPGSDPGDLKLEHFAFRGDDLAGMRARLEAHGVAVKEFPVPGTRILQLNIHDPDGNHIHVDFTVDPAEAS